jgi:hypothetical protein
MASLLAVGESCYFDRNKELWVIGTVQFSGWFHQAQQVGTARSGDETLRQNKNDMSCRVTALVSGNLRVVWNGFPIITWDKGVFRTSTDCYKVSGKTETIFEVSGRETKNSARLKVSNIVFWCRKVFMNCTK